MTVCSRRWRGPRYDVPTSVPVEHVCALPLDHDGDCKCACQLVPHGRVVR